MRSLSLSIALLLLAFALEAVGMGAHAQRQPETSHERASSEGSPRILNPETEIARLIPFVRARGGALVDKVYLKRDLSAPEVFTHRFELSTSRCVLLVGLSSGGADLNLSLLSPRGRVVASDLRQGPHPNVRYCPPEPGPHTARFQVSAGKGNVYFALFNVPSSYRAELSEEFWKEPAKAESPAEASALEPTTRRRIEVLGESLEKDGFHSIGEARGVRFSEAQARDFRLNLKGDRCYVFATFAGRGVEDTHASILGPDEIEVVSDPDRRRDSIVRLCPIEEEPLILRARLLKGSGPIFIAGWQTRPNESGVSARAQGSATNSSGARDASSSERARRGDGNAQERSAHSAGAHGVPRTKGSSRHAAVRSDIIDQQSSEGAGLDESYAMRRADLIARGYHGGDPRDGGRLDEGESREYEFRVRGGHCYAVLVAGDAGVARLVLTARDSAGGILDRDLEGAQSATVRFCPAPSEKDETIRIGVTLARGGGKLKLGLFTWPRGVRGPFGLEGVLYLRLAEMSHLLDLEAYEPSLLLDSSIGTLHREGERIAHPLRLEAGACYALVAVGDEFISDLDLTLFDGEKRIAGDSSRNAFPSIRHCQEQTRDLRFEITARRGRGKYFYQLFVRRP